MVADVFAERLNAGLPDAAQLALANELALLEPHSVPPALPVIVTTALLLASALLLALGEIDADGLADADGSADTETTSVTLELKDDVGEPEIELSSVTVALVVDDLVLAVLSVAEALALSLALSRPDRELVAVDLPVVPDGTAELDAVLSAADIVAHAVARGVWDVKTLVVGVDTSVMEFAAVVVALSRMLAVAHADDV